jgi:hypothetical protein
MPAQAARNALTAQHARARARAPTWNRQAWQFLTERLQSDGDGDVWHVAVRASSSTSSAGSGAMRGCRGGGTAAGMAAALGCWREADGSWWAGGVGAPRRRDDNSALWVGGAVG